MKFVPCSYCGKAVPHITPLSDDLMPPSRKKEDENNGDYFCSVICYQLKYGPAIPKKIETPVNERVSSRFEILDLE